METWEDLDKQKTMLVAVLELSILRSNKNEISRLMHLRVLMAWLKRHLSAIFYLSCVIIAS